MIYGILIVVCPLLFVNVLLGATPLLKVDSFVCNLLGIIYAVIYTNHSPCENPPVFSLIFEVNIGVVIVIFLIICGYNLLKSNGLGCSVHNKNKTKRVAESNGA